MRIIVAIAALFGVQAAERLVWPTAQGFVVGYTQQTPNGQVIEEQVPAGETVQAWTRMITRITLPAPIDPGTFAQRMGDMWRRSCPGATVGTPATGPKGVDIRVDCPRNPDTGKPETMVQRTIAGDGRLYVLQVAFRSAPSAAEIGWARAQLDRASLCRAGSTERACR